MLQLRSLAEAEVNPSAKSCLLLVNPISGGGKALAKYQAVADQLSAAGFQCRTHISSSQADLMSELAEANESVVYLLSGDGSIQAAAQVIVSKQLPIRLAPLPGGRGNDFCSVLGIPADISLAVANTINSPEHLEVDVMVINGSKIALGAISVGIDAAAAAISVQIQERGNRWLKGAPLYIYSALVALSRWKAISIETVIDGKAKKLSGLWLFVVSNSGQFGGGMKIAPHSKIQDGILEIISVAEVSKLDFLLTLPKVFFGRHLNHPKLEKFEARDVVISSNESVTAFADGEPLGNLPLSISVQTAALKILK